MFSFLLVLSREQKTYTRYPFTEQKQNIYKKQEAKGNRENPTETERYTVNAQPHMYTYIHVYKYMYIGVY